MKPIKFDLKLSNGEITLAFLKDVQQNLTPELFTHFYTGKLARWLRVRKFEELAEKLEALLISEKEHEAQLFKNLCEIFGRELNDIEAREILHNYKKTHSPVENSDDEIEQLHAEIQRLQAENDALKQEIATPSKSTTAKIDASEQQKIGKFFVQDGIATDTETGLTWLRFAHGQQWETGTVTGEAEVRNWDNAMKIPSEFNRIGYAGCNDWRVPTIDELKTLIDKERGEERNFIDVNVFPKNGAYFWSSSPYADGSNYAWVVGFDYGSSVSNGKYGGNYNVRLVRG